MRHLVLSVVSAGIVLISGSLAEARRAAGRGGWQRSGWVGPGRWNGHAPMSPRARTGFPPPAAFAGSPVQAPGVPMAPGVVTAPGFAGRLGGTVGWSAIPPAAMPPGIGNINHPAMQPLPIAPH